MSDLNSLNRRIDHMIAAIHQQMPAEREPLFADIQMHLFLLCEQEELRAFLDLVESKVSYARCIADLSLLSDEELERAALWLHLHQALIDEDVTSVQKYRRWLAQSREQLIQDFLSINLDAIPEDQLTGYPLSRAGYRYLECSINRKIGRIEWEYMRRWCDVFSAAV